MTAQPRTSDEIGHTKYPSTGAPQIKTMPLLKTKPCITLQLAKSLAKAAREEAERNGWNVVISILDDGANLVCLERLDGAQVGSIQVSQLKASTAVRFKRPSKAFEDMVLSGKTQILGLGLADAIPMEGGLPLFVGDHLIGGIGVSGVTSAQDGIVAQAAVECLSKMIGHL